MNSSDRDSTQPRPNIPEGGYGSPIPEDEMPPEAATDSGSPDPAVGGQEDDEQPLGQDESLGAPDRNFFQNEDASSDGEPGAGRLGGSDDQFREELSSAEGKAMGVDADNDTPLEAPSTDAPLNEDNAGPTRKERESFSSESDDDAAGEPQAN